MGKDGYSRRGFFGDIIHYDKNGNKRTKVTIPVSGI